MRSIGRVPLFVALLVALICVLPLAAQNASGRRVALVIGNSAYQSVPVLANPHNDAADMAAALGRLGFEVIPVLDGSYAQMDDAILQFSRQLAGADVGLFYYAGHGVQSGGTNYLLPVDTDVQEEFQLKQKAIDASYVLDAMNAAGAPLNIVILDACRDNPWKQMGRSIGGARGLTVVGNAPAGAIIAYATDPGAVAMDGTGRNGIFTAALLKYLPTPGLDVKDLFDKVGADVSSATKGAQNPWISSKFYGKYALAGGAVPAEAPPSTIPVPAAAPTIMQSSQLCEAGHRIPLLHKDLAMALGVSLHIIIRQCQWLIRVG